MKYLKESAAQQLKNRLWCSKIRDQIMTLPQFSGEDLVPKPADKVEEAEPWDGRQQRHAPLSPGVGHVPLLRRPSFPLPIGAAGKTYC